MNYIIALWGEEKTFKTTFALTFPKTLAHFDLDVGGFDRASWRFKSEIESKQIVSKSYATPVQIEEIAGKLGISIKMPKKLIGIKEIWQELVVDYVNMARTDCATMVLDSATQLWNIAHQSYLQELQERQVAQGVQDKDLRTRLQPIEYAEPNNRMRSLIYLARSYHKNLVLTHYPRDKYAQRVGATGIEEYKTGEVEIDGFKDTSKLVDLIVRTSKVFDGKSIIPTATISESGLHKDLVGLTIPEFSYDGMDKLIKMLRGE